MSNISNIPSSTQGTGGMPNMTGSVPGFIPVPKTTASAPLNFQNLPASGLGVTMNSSGAGKNAFSNSGAGMNTGGIIPTPKTNIASGGTPNGNINKNNGSSASPYAMTPDEASGGAAGIAAYQARIKGMNGSDSAPPPNPNPVIPGLVSMASAPTAGFTQAQNEYNQAEQELQQSKMNEAGQQTANANMPIPLNFMAGRNNTIQGEATAQQQAEAGTMAAAAEQEAAQTGQQGTQQAGLVSAAGMEAPQPANLLGTYNPSNGTYSQYGGGSGSGAATAGGVQTQEQQGAAVQQMTGTLAQAQTLASGLSDAITSSGYNPAQGIGAATTYANGVNDWLQGKSGNPQYQNVANLLSEVANKYAAILNQSGGTPTSVSQVQSNIINQLASGTDIQTILGNLQTNAQKSIDALKNASQSNANTSGSSSGNTSGNSGTPTTFTSGGFFGSQ